MSKHEKAPVEGKQNKLLAALTKNKYTLPVLGGVAAAAVIAVVAVAALQPGTGGASSVPASSASVPTSQSSPQADSTYQATEIDVEKFDGTVLPETEDAGADYIKNTLFIGDSNTVRYMSYGMCSLDNAIGVIGMGAGQIRSLGCVNFKTYTDLVKIPKAVSIIQPQRIVIGFGTNNLGGNLKTYITEYTKGIKAIYEAYPYCTIIVNAIPPVDKQRDYPNVTMQDVDEFNEALVEMCEENGWKFLNSSEALKDPDTGFCKRDYTIQDGLHLSKEGVTALFNYIRTHAYETEDVRPKPLKSVPKRGETPPNLIVKDPLKVDRPSSIHISFIASEGGFIQGNSEQSVAPGANTETVAAVPNEGFAFAGWSCTSGSIADVMNPVLTYTVPTTSASFGGVFITASFVPVGYTVSFSVSPLEGGVFVTGESTNTSATVAVNSGKTASVVFKPAEGYTLTGGGSYTVADNGNGSYTLSVANVTQNMTVEVKPQKLATPTPTPSATPAATPTAAPSATPVPTSVPTAKPSATPAVTATPQPEITPTPAVTPTPPAPTQTPVEPTQTPTQAPTQTPTQAPVCGAVGHSTEGTCPACGESYTAPVCGAVGHSAEGTCPACGDSYTAPVCGAVGHSAEGICPACGDSYTAPVCGEVGHSVVGKCLVCGTVKEEPVQAPASSVPAVTANSTPTDGAPIAE